MKEKGFVIAGLISAALAVGLGAIGSHALDDLLIANDRMDTYGTAVDYHMFHSIGLLIIASLIKVYTIPFLKTSGILMAAGIVFFSGSLYLLSVTNLTFWAYFTPLGGLMFIVAWLFPVFGIILKKQKD